PGTALRARRHAAGCLLFNELIPFLLHGKPLHLLYDRQRFLMFFHSSYKRDNSSDFLTRYSSSSINPPSNSSLICCNFPLISPSSPAGGTVGCEGAGCCCTVPISLSTIPMATPCCAPCWAGCPS